ncbi:hypothetical protein PHISP_07406 [Aspergillus sp. HF37]|nr:hypothetical protein PHISP_07406 [Aspergillus sp. HF37]
MPIPAPSRSLRDPREQLPTTGRTTASKSITATTTSTTGVPSTTAEKSGRDANASNRRKTVSSHRNSLQDGRAPQQESRLPARGNTHQGQESSVTRRQSVTRPPPLKSVPSKPPAGSTTRNTTISPAATSPRKARETPKDLPQKKTDMPPPPRPARSASVRQPARTNQAATAGARGHARHRSQQVISVTRDAAKKTEPPSPASDQRPKSQPGTHQRPPSPKKPVKPTAPTPVGLEPSPFLSSWPEIAALQTEMLQLSLFHSSSAQRNAEYRAESEDRLRRKHESVAGAYKSILADKRENQRRVNGRALDLWSKNSHERKDRQGFPEQIQLLSQIAQEVSNLSDDTGGRYTLAIQEFEKWFQNADEIRKSRSQHEASNADPAAFIDPLDHACHEELHALGLKLELCSKQLQSLDILGYGDIEALEDSALPRIAKGLRDMTDVMASEIHTIRSIEADIVKSERLWVSQLSDRLVASQRQRPNEGGSRTGIWVRERVKP